MYSILHIDNSIFFRKLLQDVAIDQDCIIYSASNKKEAFEILDSKNIDLIISGLSFEDDSNEELIPEIKNSPHRDIPVAIFSADNNLDNRRKYIKYGITDFISKSNNMSMLSKMIHKYKNTCNLDKEVKNLSFAVIDDNKLQRELLKSMFQQYSIYNVDFFESGEAFFEKDREYDVYIVDLILPGILGIDMILQLRKQYSDNIIVAISNVNFTETIQNVILAGADDYIIKPINEDIFFARLKSNVRTYTLLKELEEKNKILEHLIKIDSLTQIYNHKSIVDKVYEFIEQKYDFSIAMLDLDYFKSVNDTYGHLIGDEVLVSISNQLVNHFPKPNYVGRYGGEEFLVIMKNSSIINALKQCENFRKALDTAKINSIKSPITISGGVVEFTGQTTAELIKTADVLLYKAKESGRNKILIK